MKSRSRSRYQQNPQADEAVYAPLILLMLLIAGREKGLSVGLFAREKDYRREDSREGSGERAQEV